MYFLEILSVISLSPVVKFASKTTTRSLTKMGEWRCFKKQKAVAFSWDNSYDDGDDDKVFCADIEFLLLMKNCTVRYYELKSYFSECAKTYLLQKQPPEVRYKKGVLKNFANLTGKHLRESLIFIKFQAWGLKLY